MSVGVCGCLWVSVGVCGVCVCCLEKLCKYVGQMWSHTRTTREDTVAPVVRAGDSIVPGCSIAWWILQMIMIQPLGLPFSQCRVVQVYMDDVTIQVISDRRDVVEKAHQATDALANAFQRGADLPVSRSQAKAISSCSSIAHSSHINLQVVRARRGAGHRAKRGTAQAERDVQEEVGSHHGPLGALRNLTSVTCEQLRAFPVAFFSRPSGSSSRKK